MLDILGSKGTNSPEGQALIKEIEAVQGAGNWYSEWARLQDYYTAKYLAAKSDAERLAKLQASSTQQDYGTQYVPAGAVPYSIHDINAFQAMSAEEQAQFLLGFSDPNAAGYFSAVAGVKPGVQELMDAARGIQYMGASGKLYPSYDAMVAAGDVPGGKNTIITHDGTVLEVSPTEPVDVETVFGPGSGTSTVPQWQAPTAPAPITNPYTPTNGSTEGGVPVPAPVQPTPVLVAPPKPSGSLTPTTTTTPSGGGGGTFVDVTKPPTTKPSGGGGGALPGDAETGTTQAGMGSGALGLLAVAALGLALFRKGKR